MKNTELQELEKVIGDWENNFSDSHTLVQYQYTDADNYKSFVKENNYDAE